MGSHHGKQSLVCPVGFPRYSPPLQPHDRNSVGVPIRAFSFVIQLLREEKPGRVSIPREWPKKGVETFGLATVWQAKVLDKENGNCPFFKNLHLRVDDLEIAELIGFDLHSA